MADDNNQPKPDSFTEVRQQSDASIREADTMAALEEIREGAALPESWREQIYYHAENRIAAVREQNNRPGSVEAAMDMTVSTS